MANKDAILTRVFKDALDTLDSSNTLGKSKQAIKNSGLQKKGTASLHVKRSDVGYESTNLKGRLSIHDYYKNQLLPTEGDVGTYKKLSKDGNPRDDITAHHMPSKKYMEQYGIKKNDGISMNMEHPFPGTGGRHRLTKTFGRNMNNEEKMVYYNLSPRDALAFDIKDVKKIYKDQGLYNSTIREGLTKVIKLNEKSYPEIFGKTGGKK